MKLVQFLWLQFCVILATTSIASCARLQDLVILDELLRDGYDRRATPTNHLNNTTPTKVFCELYVRSFGSPNPLTMDYKVDLYLRQRWKDERLKHKDLHEPLDLNDPNLVKAIWKPEVYFPNGKEADFQFVTVPNVLVRIHPDGEILYMLRLKVTFSCMMNLSKFPLDRQTCTMEVASFSKTKDELILEWKAEDPITIGNLGMSQFELGEIAAEKCSESIGQIGNYSCLVAEYHLSRSLGFHLVQSYLPTILMVVISWVSFWMDVNSVPGRVTLGITTLLTVSSKSTTYVGVPLELDIQENLPQASYVKAIDVWMGTCTGFVFLALLEFTVVNYLWRKEYHRSFLPKPQSTSSTNTQGGGGGFADITGGNGNKNVNSIELQRRTSSPREEGNAYIRAQRKEKEDSHLMAGNNLDARFVSSTIVLDPPLLPSLERDMSALMSENLATVATGVEGIDNGRQMLESSSGPFVTRARTIDETCRFAFPLAFACFNFIYWPYYLLT